MATTLICGFELRSTSEAFSVTGAPSISTSVFRGGSASLRCNPSASVYSLLFRKIVAITGGAESFAQSFRFYMRIDVLPDVKISIAQAGGHQIELNADGTLTTGDLSTRVASTNALTADAQWHRIDCDSSGTTRTLYVDGVQWSQAAGVVGAATSTDFNIGVVSSGTADIYFDDLVVDGASIGAPVSGANNKVALLLPTAGNNAGSWTNGAGGTGDIHAGVANVPPIGAAAATAGAKIKNAASGTALDYVATMQTYLAAGIPAGSTINAVQALCNDGEEVATGTKSGGIWCASNPAQSAVVIGSGVGFDYGNDSGALATFPTGWTTHFGNVAANPSVTLSTAPTVTVRKGSSTTRVVDVDFMGLYVDYTPPPIGRIIAALQAVNRASTY